MRTLKLAGIAMLALLASGCGQRGALYLPDRQSNVVVRPAQDSDVPQASPIPQASPAPAPADAGTTAPAGAAASTDTDPPRRSNATQRN